MEILFEKPASGGTFNVVSITTSPTLSVRTPVPVPRGGLLSARAGYYGPRNWDIAPDGRLIGMVDTSSQAAPRIQVVLNWLEELKQRVPVK